MKAQPNNFPHFKAKLMRVQCSAAPLFPSLLALLFFYSFPLFLLWRDLMCRDCLLFPVLTA